jgi:DNA (cytosine-5)-methyltransferase 1
MKIGSLFSGVGGLELGLEWAGVGHTIWQVERSPYKLAQLSMAWPDALRFYDVAHVGAHNLPPVDVICGGFPCTDISVAGKGAGLTGRDSRLWYEMLRIIREMGPRYVVVENVAALTNRGLDAILGALASSGYDAQWSSIRAADVGAWHERNRLFVIAWTTANAERDAVRQQPERIQQHASKRRHTIAGNDGATRSAADADSARRQEQRRAKPARAKQLVALDAGDAAANSDDEPRRLERQRANDAEERDETTRQESERSIADVADAHSARLQQLRESEAWSKEQRNDWRWNATSRCAIAARRASEWWSTEPDVVRVVHGLSNRLDRIRCLGDSVVPQVAEVVGRRLMAIHASLAPAALEHSA